MVVSLVNPNDSPERQNEKLIKIAEALMSRVEQNTERSAAAYAQFERAALLEDQVKQRTADLEYTLDLLNASNAALAHARADMERAHDTMAGALEAIQDGFALFDENDRLIMRNSRFGRHTPDTQELITPGMRFADYVETVSRSAYMELAKDETPETWAAHRMQRHRDAHAIFNAHLKSDTWLQISEHRTSNGGTAILQTDVTDLVRLERVERGKLLDDQALFVRATLDHMTQGVCIFDREMRLMGWNSRVRALLFLPASGFRLGVSFRRLDEHLQAYFPGSDSELNELRTWVSRDGLRRPLRMELARALALTLEVHAQDMPDGGMVISFSDISAERSAAQALATANETLERRVLERTLELEDAVSLAESANASKSRFIAAASHDLLQPLSAAKLYIESIATQDSGIVNKALGALKSAEEIIDALLNISKLDAGSANIDVTTVSLGKILDSLRSEFAPAARLKGLDFRVVPTTAWVASDPGYLRQIAQNLIGNAVRYTQTGRVLVGVRRKGRFVRLEIWDTGPGIAAKDQERIFNEFERLDQTGPPDQGLGLGLAIVERACGQLGHPLVLRSKPGRGTYFSVGFETRSAK